MISGDRFVGGSVWWTEEENPEPIAILEKLLESTCPVRSGRVRKKRWPTSDMFTFRNPLN